MIFRKLIGLGFLAMMLFVFLGAFGSMRQSRTNMAYMQGYIAGQQAAAGEDGAVNGNAATAPPMPPYSYNTHFRGHGGFFPGIRLVLLPAAAYVLWRYVPALRSLRGQTALASRAWPLRFLARRAQTWRSHEKWPQTTLG